MKYASLLLVLLVLSCSPKKIVKDDNNSKPFDKTAIATEFISLVKKNDKDAIAKRTLYPLNRQHPLPEVVNKQDFLIRYEEIFDANFRNMIANSDPSKDWEEVGSRGIMFDNGKLWVDFNGQLFAVNYQSETEKEKISISLTEKNKHLHPSIRVFEKAILEMETKSFKIRIDDLGDYKYRYTAWTTDKKESDKPFLVLQEGTQMRDGSGGNHFFSWDNGPRRYEVYVIVLGANDSPPAMLNVYEGLDKLIEEDAIEFKN